MAFQLIKISTELLSPLGCSLVKLFQFQSLKNQLLALNVEQQSRAHFVCKVIPPQCPFERTIHLFKWTLHIPPLCHLNPFYNELVTLRFRALSYLSDVCGEDITRYCH
jgi:hypothetical protein